MSGINILNATQIMESPLWTVLLIAFGILCLAVSFALFFVSCLTIGNKSIIIAIILFIVGLISLFVGVDHSYTIPTGKYKYEVTIDENVSFTELNSKYNIIEQRGSIYVLEDK